MANTFELIASSTVGSGGASTIDFTSIPSTYNNLCLKLSLRNSGTTGNYDPVKIKINTSSSNFSNRRLYGTGTSAGSETPTSTDTNIIAYTSNSNNTASTFGNIEIYLPNYTSTSYPKSISSDGVAENNASGSFMDLTAALWNPSTQAAINAISVTPYTGTFVQYSTAYLYGIKNS